MSEHSPLPWKLQKGEDLDGNPQVWYVLDANDSAVITTDCGYYTKFEGDYDLIVDAVNSIDRLRAQNEELVKVSTLAKIQLNAIANELKSDFNLAHDNMASNACWLAETIEQALKSAEVK